jgi:putative DNA primase/helicase
MSCYQNVESFRQIFLTYGLTPPETINTNGKIQRYGIKKRSWYVYHDGDIASAAFGDWKFELSEKWCSKNVNQLTAGEREEWRKQQAEQSAIFKAELLAKQTEAAIKAARLWSEARPDVDLKHAYLVAKGIYPHGAKQLGQALILPLYGQNKALVGCQFIYGDGSKRFITGTKKQGSFCCLKPPNYHQDDTQTIYLVEGWATGVSVFMAMYSLVFVAFDKGNLKAVAVFLRGKYPKARIVVCGDNDADGGGQRAANDAAKAVNGFVVIPNEN